MGDQLPIDRRAVLGAAAAGLSSAAVPVRTRAQLFDGTTGPHLRLGTLQPPVSLDPITAKYVGSLRGVNLVFDGLYGYGDGTEIRPRLAAGEPTREDDRTLRVAIREDARFGNGDPVTPADVAYSYTVPTEEDAPAKAAVDAVESVEAVDDHTVRIRLSHPFPGLDRLLTFPIVPKSVREADPEAFAAEPVGAGPFRVERFSEEKRTKLTRRTDYSGDRTPAVDAVTLAYVESPLTAAMSIRTRRTDMVEPVSAQVSPKLRGVSGGSMARAPGYRSFYLGFNTNDGPTEDRRVRDAICRCIDLESAVSEFMGPLGKRQYGPVPPAVADDWEFPREEWRDLVPGKDVAAARRGFREADAASGQFRILTTKDPRYKEFGERLARGLRDAGHGALVKPVPWTKYLERYVSGAAEDYAVFVGEVAGTDDPDSYLYPTLHENMAGLTNGTFYNEESVMNDLLSARRTTDRATRRERYVSASRRLLEDRAILPICSVQNSFAYGPSVRGLELHPIPWLNPRLTGSGVTMRRPDVAGDARGGDQS